MGVTVFLSCESCGDIDSMRLSFRSAGAYALTGDIHNSVPDTHSEMRSLLKERKTGWNTYDITLCQEAAQKGYEKCNVSCKGKLKVSLT